MVRHSPSPRSERFAMSLLVDFLASSLSRLSSPFPIGISVDGAAVMSYSPRSLHLPVLRTFPGLATSNRETNPLLKALRYHMSLT